MTSIFQKPLPLREDIAMTKQTTRLQNRPQAISRLAIVVAVVEQHFLSDQWETEVVRGSVRLRHKINGRWLVRVFIDDGNTLAKRSNLQLSEEPIVVGVDLTDMSPYERHLIREDLRSRFPYYIDPEAGGEKIKLKADYGHWLDILFIPEGACTLPVDQQRVAAILDAIKLEDASSSTLV